MTTRAPTVAAATGRPLAPQQRGLWFLQQLRPGSSEYNLQIALRLRGPLAVPCLRDALNLLVQRHEALRTRIAADTAGVPRQFVSAPTPTPLVAEHTPAAAEQAIGEILREEVRHPFDLAGEWPMRVRLVELGPDDHLLVLTFNHLAMDGVSLGIVSDELTRAYAALAVGEPVSLPELPVSFSQHAQDLAARGPDADGLEFWRRELRGVGDLSLPADRRGHGVGASMIVLRPPVAPETVDGLTRLARVAGTSLFSVTLSAYALLLHRSTGQRDFAIGMPVAGRTDPATEHLVGCLLNTVCVRFRIDPEEPVRGLVRRTGGAVAGALQHQSVPFGDVVRAVRPERANSRHPLFSAFCSVLDEAPPAFEMAGIRTEPVVVDYPVARFDLNATFALGLQTPAVQMEFSDALFEPATARRLADRIVRVLDWVGADPDRPVQAVPLVGRSERSEVLDLLNGRTGG